VRKTLFTMYIDDAVEKKKESAQKDSTKGCNGANEGRKGLCNE
jgi:hypothetical protein